MGKESSISDAQCGTLMMQSVPPARDFSFQQEHPSSTSLANHSQDPEAEDPPPDMRDNAVQTCQFFKVEAEEMPIEPPQPDVREIAVQTCRPVKEEDEEMSCEPPRKRIKSEPIYDSTEFDGPIIQVEEIPRLSAVKEETEDSFPISACQYSGHRNTSAKEEESPDRSSLAACSQLVSSIIQGVLVIRKQRVEKRRIKAESEDMAIDPDTDDEQDIEDQLPRLNQSFNQLLPVVEEHLAEFVKQEQEEVSVEAAPQDDQAVSELMDSLSQLAPVLQKQNEEVRPIKEVHVEASQLVKAEDEEMSIDPVADDEGEASQIEPENEAITSHIVKAEDEEISIEEVMHEQNANRTYCLREVFSRLVGAVTHLQQIKQHTRERRTRIEQENVRSEAEEATMEPNQDVRQTRNERPVLVLSETPNPPHELSSNFLTNAGDGSQQNDDGPENEGQMSPFVEAEAEEGFIEQIMHDCLRESCQDRRRERLQIEAEETSIEPNQDVRQMRNERPVLVLSENTVQTSQAIMQGTPNGQYEQNEGDNSQQLDQFFMPEQNDEGLENEWQMFPFERPLEPLMNDHLDRLRESRNRLLSKVDQLMQALRLRQQQTEDGRRERLQTEAGKTSNKQNQNVQQLNSQVSVRKEGENQTPVLPENEHPASQSITERPHSSTEPMAQHGRRELSNTTDEMSESKEESNKEAQDGDKYLPNDHGEILSRSIKSEMSESEEDLDKTQDFNHYLSNARSELLNGTIKRKMSESEESEDEMQNGGQDMTNGRRELPNQTDTNEASQTEEQSKDETQDGRNNMPNDQLLNQNVTIEISESKDETCGQDNDQRELLNQNVTLSESEEESEDEMQVGDHDIPSEPLNQTVQNEMSESEERDQSQNDIFSVTHNETFNCTEVKHNLHFSGGSADFGAYHSNIVNALELATRKSLVYAKQGDKIQIELRNAELQNNVSVILENENDLSGLNTLLDRLGEANSSVKHLEMVVQIVKAPVGGVKRKRQDMEDMLRRKQQHLYIPQCDDRLSLAISLAYLLNPGIDDSQAANLGAEMQRRVDLNEQIPTLNAQALRRLGLTNGYPASLVNVVKFEMLVYRKIVVFYHRHNPATLDQYRTPFLKMEDSPVYLYRNQNRYYGICNLREFLDGNYFCDRCLFDISNAVENHNCQTPCPICCKPACVKEDPVYCKDCNRHCKSRKCYEAHKRKKSLPNGRQNVRYCESRKRCKKCNYIYNTPSTGNSKHKCLPKPCSTCGVDFPENTHKCYMKPLASVQNHSKVKLVFYEFKTYVDESGKRVPFVLSIKTLQGMTWTVHGEQCIVNFLRHFRSTTCRGMTFVSLHPDTSILLDSMIEMGLSPNVVMHNGKIASIELPDCKLTFVDAAVFLPMPLDKLPAVFKFNTYKGFFPVGFISKENLQYVGPCPAPEFYALDEMSEKRRQEFDEAYGLASNREFNFKREAKIYCEDDLEVLTTACVKLREWFIDSYSVDPFSCTTLQSFGMDVFRAKFLPENTLAIPLFDDYKPNRRPRSDAGIEWLEWVMSSEEIFIQHALNKGSKRTTDLLFFDGYSDVDGDKVIWEFIDCKENGCPVCFPGADNRGRRRWCKDRLARLESFSDAANIRLVVIREHAWNEIKTSEAAVSALKNYKPPQPLALHELSFASMNGVAKLQHAAASDERIMFAEVDSLFPYVMANNPYPTGHPRLFFEKFVPPQSYFGLIKAVVSPPKDLLFPVLPYKSASGKTVFTLCRTCADSNQQSPCNHTRKERAITGVWVTPEFNKALEMGYELRHIVEVWHFKEKSSTLFEDFVSDFVKGKQESSGSATKHIYKSSLDEFWRGFGDRSVELQTQTVSKDADFSKLVFSDERKVESFKILGDKTALVQLMPNQNAKPAPKNTDNVLVTAFTAAYGRLHLYSILQKLQEKVLYYDTDRVVYVAKGEQNEPEFGDAPGKLTDKLAGDAIREFASVGPKSYAYRTETKRVVLNVKGITRTLENCEDVNLSVTDVARGSVAPSDGNRRETIKTVYEQRRILPSGNTVPFGHC